MYIPTKNYVSVTHARKDLPQLLDQATQTSKPIILSKNGIVAGAIISPDILDIVGELVELKNWQNSLPLTKEEIQGVMISKDQIATGKVKKIVLD